MNQTKNFSDSAAEAYVWCSWFLAVNGFLSYSILRLRLQFIADEAEDGPARQSALDLLEELSSGEEKDEDDWERSTGESNGSAESGDIAPDPDEPPILHFIIALPNAGKWDFHKYDVDPHPSVPHGHEKGGRKKLDAYLGFTYVGANQGRRLGRDSIIFLWNDERFRSHAYQQIAWFIRTNPGHLWNVPHPLTLPRRRRR